MYGATIRMNRPGRATGTARRPFDAWNPVDRETNARQTRNMFLTRIASRDVLWSFIFIPRPLPCRYLVALKIPGLISRSTLVCAVRRPGAVFPWRSGHFFRVWRRSRFPVSVFGTAGRHIVDCRANAYAKSRPSRAKSRRIKGSGEVGSLLHRGRCPICFKFERPAAAAAAGPNARRRAAQRPEKISLGLSRTRYADLAPRARRDATPVKIAKCFKPETRNPIAWISHT
ncbi:hypothetical protein LGM43_14110 [Burkholderia seminalis]|uniref:hypothetical protein n=1 Tax=Burkholderia seminalis TaxID=488731 RepID=UPI001CF2BC18|nr:hypothetical protein [Burkholderia seminalis]MCA7951403.1 hypothetical protein [Burkholderia seminalis]